jgi:hypothetical protein
MHSSIRPAAGQTAPVSGARPAAHVSDAIRRRVPPATASPAIPGSRPCTCTLRIHTAGVLLDGHKSTKASTSRLSWSPSGPQRPGDARAASRVTASRPLRPPLLTASHYLSVLTPTLAAGTAAHGRGTSRAASRRAWSTPRLSLMWRIATSWLRRSPWLGPAGARASVRKQAEVIVGLI